MKTFSVGEQSVREPISGFGIDFIVDDNDSGIMRCRVRAPDTQDYMEATFRRNGTLLSTEMIDHEAAEDAHQRKLAAARVALYGPAPVTEEAKKAANEEREKQIEADKALLASEPKVSKYAEKPDAEEAKE